MATIDEGYNEDDDDLEFNYRQQPLLSSSLQPSNSKSTLCGIIDINKGNVVPWEEVALSPLSNYRHLTWDKLQVPIPQRYDPVHVKLAEGNTSASKEPQKFLFDSKQNLEQCMDTVWKLSPILSSHPTLKDDVNSGHKVNYISSPQFIQCVFHLLGARTSAIFIWDKENTQFTIQSTVLVRGLSPGTVISYSKFPLKLGTTVKRFMLLVAAYESDSFVSSIIRAFITFVANYLRIYQTILMLNSSCIRTLTILSSFLKSFGLQWETLDCIWGRSDDDIFLQDPISLLNRLNYFVHSSEACPVTCQLVQGVFRACSSAYLKHVSDWIFRGQLTNQSEFHVESVKKLHGPYMDRRFWTKQFSLKSSVPQFLTDSFNLIFETGKAINLLTYIQRQNIFSKLLSDADTDEMLTPVFDFEGLDQIFLLWDAKLHSFRESQAKLVSDIYAAIKSVSSPFDEQLFKVDLKELEAIRRERYIKHMDSIEETRQIKRLKQKAYFEGLEEQVAEKKIRQQKELEQEQLENKRDVEFLEMREKRDKEEEKRMNLKHFGDESGPLSTHQNFFQHLHNTSSKRRGNNNEDCGDGSILPSIPSKVHSDDNNECIFDSEKIGDEIRGSPAKSILAKTKDEEEKMSDFSQTKKESLLLLLNETDEEEDDERFDPEKVKTTKPPPYNLSISFENQFSKKMSKLFNSPSADSVSTNQTPDKDDDEYCQIAPPYHRSIDSHSVSMFLSESVAIPLSFHSQITNIRILHYFICEQKLFQHVEALNNFLCLQNGQFGHFLSEQLIKEVNIGNLRSERDIASKIGRLSMILSEAIYSSTTTNTELENDFSGKLAFAVKPGAENLEGKKTASAISSPYDVLNSLTLCYNISWPLCIILTDEILHHFETLFSFQMRLSRAEILLNQTFLYLKPKNSKSEKLISLQRYRARLLHFVKTTKHYVNVTVIQCAWNELCSSMDKLNSMDNIYESIVRHIKSITTSCLLGPKGEAMMKLLLDQLVLTESFCCQIEKIISGENVAEISSSDFKTLTQKYKAAEEIGKLFIEVAYKTVKKGYYPKVSYFLDMYNFNQFFNTEGRIE